LGAVQSGTMIHACIRPSSGVKVSNYVRLFTQPLAAGNAGWRLQFRIRGRRHQPRVPELWTLGVIRAHHE